MSILDRSLALGEIKGSVDPLIDLLPVQYLSINLSTPAQPVCQVVKVSGNIAVSF